MRSLQIDYDTDYGIDHRSGWSVHINGICYVELVPHLLPALWVAWRMYRRGQAELRREREEAKSLKRG
jgi:hypothetical protein